eukprot:135489_1
MSNGSNETEPCDPCACHGLTLPFAPTIEWHFFQGNAPEVFYWFWGIGFVCVIVTSVIIIPHICKLKKESIKIRDAMDSAFGPMTYKICIYISAFPYIGTVFNFIPILGPVTYVIFILLLNLYQGVVLYLFARLIIMYLGSYKSALIALSADTTEPTKFYAAPPLCCVRSCVKPKRMNASDFRNIYRMIQQYIFLAPFTIFLTFFIKNNYAIYYGRLCVSILSVIQILTSVCCMYASQCLLSASKQLLSEYEIVGKFKMVQFGVFALTIPTAVINLMPISDINIVYDSVIMKEAYASFVSCVLYALLTPGFKRFFGLQTAVDAMENAQKKSYVKTCNQDTDNEEIETQQIIDTEM